MTPSRFVILFLLGAFVWSGCSNVTFTEPMPLNRRDLPKFPSKWRGTWSDGKDMTVTIGESYFEGDDLEKVTSAKTSCCAASTATWCSTSQKKTASGPYCLDGVGKTS